MAIEELIGKKVLIVTPGLTTPPEKKRSYIIGIVRDVSAPMMKLSECRYTHLEEKVWERSFEELCKEDYMRNIGFDGTCWVNYQSERMRIYPFPE